MCVQDRSSRSPVYAPVFYWAIIADRVLYYVLRLDVCLCVCDIKGKTWGVKETEEPGKCQEQDSHRDYGQQNDYFYQFNATATMYEKDLAKNSNVYSPSFFLLS